MQSSKKIPLGQTVANNSGGGGGVPEAPIDGELYGRKDADWEIVPTVTPFDPSIDEAGLIDSLDDIAIIDNDTINVFANKTQGQIEGLQQRNPYTIVQKFNLFPFPPDGWGTNFEPDWDGTKAIFNTEFMNLRVPIVNNPLEVSFDLWRETFDFLDFVEFRFQVSTNGGSSYSDIEIYTDVEIETFPQTFTIDLSNYSEIKKLIFRFRKSDGTINAIYLDNFNLKYSTPNSDYVEQILFSENDGVLGSHTGTTSDTVILNIDIPAGTYKIGDWIPFIFDFTKIGTASVCTVRIRAGVTGTTGDSLIATMFLTAPTLDSTIARYKMRFETGNLLVGTQNVATIPTDLVSVSASKTSASLDPSADWILTVSASLGSSADEIQVVGYRVGKIKTF